MKWTHIVAECYCLYKENNEIPKCCKFKPEHIGLHCFDYDYKDKRYCPFLSLGTAKSTIILTDNNGELKSFDSFNNDNIIDENEWYNKEEAWLTEWEKKISMQKVTEL